MNQRTLRKAIGRRARGWGGLIACLAMGLSSAAFSQIPGETAKRAYDLAPWLEKCAERKEAWSTAEWRLQPAFEPGITSSHSDWVIRTSPDHHWAQSIQDDGRVRHTYFSDSHYSWHEHRVGPMASSPNRSTDLVSYLRRSAFGSPRLSIALPHRMGANLDGDKLSQRSWDLSIVTDLGVEPLGTQACRKIAIQTAMNSELRAALKERGAEAMPLRFLWLDERETWLVLRQEWWDPMTSLQTLQPEVFETMTQTMHWHGVDYGLVRWEQVQAWEELNGWAHASLVEGSLLGETRRYRVQASIPPGGAWPEGLLSLEIPPNAKIQDLDAGDT